MPSMMKEFRSNETTTKGIRDFAGIALQNLTDAHDTIIKARVIQTNQANKHR